MEKYLSFIPLLLLFCFVVGCQQSEEVEALAVDVEAETMKVQNVLHQYINAIKAKSTNTLEEIFSQNDDLLMLDGNTSRTFIGWEAIKSRYREHFNSYENLEVKFRDLSVKIHASGKVAWLSCVFDWNYLSQGERLSTDGLRATWILEKMNNEWRVVQLHFSFPKTNE